MRIVPWALLFAIGAGISSAQAMFPAYHPSAGLGITGAPYSAKQTRVRTQTAADGQKFTTTEVTLIWRDAEGRTRQESLRRMPSGQEYRSIEVEDPVARIRLSWGTPPAGIGVSAKSVTIWPLTNPWKTGPPRMLPTVTGSWPNGNSRVLLDPQQINGVDAQGLRLTNTESIGMDENGHELRGTLVVETWVAPQLGIMLRQIVDDPRTGRIATDLTDVVPGDPDPALFRPPPGYQVRDTRENQGGPG